MKQIDSYQEAAGRLAIEAVSANFVSIDELIHINELALVKAPLLVRSLEHCSLQQQKWNLCCRRARAIHVRNHITFHQSPRVDSLQGVGGGGRRPSRRACAVSYRRGPRIYPAGPPPERRLRQLRWCCGGGGGGWAGGASQVAAGPG